MKLLTATGLLFSMLMLASCAGTFVTPDQGPNSATERLMNKR